MNRLHHVDHAPSFVASFLPSAWCLVDRWGIIVPCIWQGTTFAGDKKVRCRQGRRERPPLPSLSARAVPPPGASSTGPRAVAPQCRGCVPGADQTREKQRGRRPPPEGGPSVSARWRAAKRASDASGHAPPTLQSPHGVSPRLSPLTRTEAHSRVVYEGVPGWVLLGNAPWGL